MSKNISHLSGRKGLDQNLFETIGNQSQSLGALPIEESKSIAEEFLLGTANVFGTASFYDFTRDSNKGKKIYLCNGSACLVSDTQNKLKKELRQHFEEHEIGEMCCLGRCYENAAFHYQGHNYSQLEKNQISEIVANPKEIKNEYNVIAKGQRILTGNEKRIEDYSQYFGFLKQTKEQLLQEIKDSNLRGRGGAGFPTWIKLDGCKAAQSDTKFIVCNADEGDPGSFSDRYLLEEKMPLVLIGMMIEGYITGATKAVVYIRAEYPESVRIAQQTVDEFTQRGWLGNNILGSGFDFTFKIIKAQGAYICGEETALLSSIEGQRPEVRVRPPFPVQEGLFRKPTVVNNVETLASLPWICLNGGAHYAKIGTSKSTGTKLISLDSGFVHSGIAEVPMGTSLKELVYDLAGGFKRETKALHIGGPLGGLVPMNKIEDLTVDFESFSSQGFMLGHASIISIPQDYPMIQYIEHLFEFTAHESCGKCFPCRIGSTRGKELIQKAQQDPSYKIDSQLLLDLLDTMKRGSLCALGGGIPLPVYNALQYFKEEFEIYIKPV